ncbi:hypothetical protein P4O66_004941, partial [Electrophorus voltai]
MKGTAHPAFLGEGEGSCSGVGREQGSSQASALASPRQQAELRAPSDTRGIEGARNYFDPVAAVEGDPRRCRTAGAGAGDELELSMPFLFVMGRLNSLKQGERDHFQPVAMLGVLKEDERGVFEKLAQMLNEDEASTSIDLPDTPVQLLSNANIYSLNFQRQLICCDFHKQPSLGFTEDGQKKKLSSERQFSEGKCLVDARGRRRMASLIWSDRKATVTPKTTRYYRSSVMEEKALAGASEVPQAGWRDRLWEQMKERREEVIPHYVEQLREQVQDDMIPLGRTSLEQDERVERGLTEVDQARKRRVMAILRGRAKVPTYVGRTWRGPTGDPSLILFFVDLSYSCHVMLYQLSLSLTALFLKEPFPIRGVDQEESLLQERLYAAFQRAESRLLNALRQRQAEVIAQYGEISEATVNSESLVIESDLPWQAAMVYRGEGEREREREREQEGERQRKRKKLSFRELSVRMAEKRLRRESEQEQRPQKAEVWVALISSGGALLRTGTLSKTRPTSEVDWVRAPQPVEVCVGRLRAVREKLPRGPYAVSVSLHTRLAGPALLWSGLKRKRWAGVTEPVEHGGRYCDTDLCFHQSLPVVLPAPCDLLPSTVLVFRLLSMPSEEGPVSGVVAWGAFPVCNCSLALTQGTFRTPLLWGSPRPALDRFSKIEQLLATDLDTWLCNLYFQVRRVPREQAGVREGAGTLHLPSAVQLGPSTGTPEPAAHVGSSASLPGIAFSLSTQSPHTLQREGSRNKYQILLVHVTFASSFLRCSTGVTWHRTTVVQLCHSTILKEYRSKRVPEYSSTGVQEYRVSQPWSSFHSPTIQVL